MPRATLSGMRPRSFSAAATTVGPSPGHLGRRQLRTEFAMDSLLEEAVTSELVSEMPISLVTGKNTGNSAPITTRALINASRSNVLRPKFPDEETGKFSRAEQRIDLPHQGKLLRDQGKKQPTVERERDPWPICLDATPASEPAADHVRYDLSARAAASTLEMRS